MKSRNERSATEERSTVFFLVVFREAQVGVNQKLFASVSNLIRFLESEDDDIARGMGSGEFDVYYVDVLALEIAKYDLAPIRALMKTPRRKSREK